mmetsp:Transcript_101934/g.243006  ORF Transcript_101934/g.243006 Transcript_101934/m.243006 type:complete len:320 (+) Transcript_101934:53-1012(+)
MMKAAAAAALVASASAELGASLHLGHDHFGGHEMERSFLMYTELPMGEAALKAKGWHKHGSTCDPHLGYAWTEEAAGNTKSAPIVLYTTQGGQVSGVGMTVVGYDGNAPMPAEQKKWATASPLAPADIAEEVAHIDVAFRSGEIVCSGKTEAASVGTTLIVNPAGGAGKSMTIPLKEAEVQKQGWHKGSCFDGMGYHWFLDTSKQDGTMSWMAQNLFPVVAMYHEGEMNAIFFAAHLSQVSIPFLKANEWDPAGLDSEKMCKNTCDEDCDFKGMVDTFSTAHVYFRDHKEVTCPSDLKCGITFPLRASCCEAERAAVLV